MREIRTEETLRKTFGKEKHNWQTKELMPVEDLSYVISNLLKENFVVEIKGHKYDISFGKSTETGDISYSWSSSPSPHLTSWKIIEEAFRNGKWFVVEEG